ncbi:MAG TPA: hypothetical protein VK174_14455 [Chitinophagales bacterium]|nr:hypothetical protein [Chitinophagales bacterium]
MKPICIALFLTFALVKACFSQQVKVVELYVLGAETESVWSGHELKFPFIITSDKAVQANINKTILEQIFDSGAINVSDTNSIKQAIDTQATEYISEITFEVTLNSGNWLQINITQTGVAAYSFENTHYFLFNTQTGNRYMLIDLVKTDKQNLFAKKVLADQKDSLNNYLLNIKNELLAIGAEDDSSTINEIADLISQCYEYMDEKNETGHYDFHLAKDRILIETSCGFPRYARVFQPYYRITYHADYIKDYLLPELYQQLISEKGKK